MALRKIRLDGDPVLRKKTTPVTRFSQHLHRLLQDMTETMFASEGVGLAAPQVGISKSIVVVRDEDKILELINPEITSSSGENIDLEGCLSVPGIYGEVPRHERIEISGFDKWGGEMHLTATGFLARIFQHEIDHLRGILFIDRARRLLTPEEIKKISRQKGSAG